MGGHAEPSTSALVEHAAGVIRAAQPDAVILDSGLSSPTMGTGIVLDLLAQGKDDEALEAYQRYYARRHTSRTRDYPELTTVADLRALIATREVAVQPRRHRGHARDWPRTASSTGLQMHFYERWDAAPLLIEFLRSRIPADMPIEAWEVGLFDVDEAKSESVLTEEVTKTVSQLLAYGVGRVLWLPLAADPNGTGGEEKRFGLLEPDGTPRAVADAFEELVRISNGATLQPLDSEGLLGFVARQGDTATVVAWATDAAGRGRLGGRRCQPLGATTTTAERGDGHRHQPGDDRGPDRAGRELAGAADERAVERGPGAARRQDRCATPRLRGPAARALGPRGGRRQAGRGGSAQR